MNTTWQRRAPGIHISESENPNVTRDRVRARCVSIGYTARMLKDVGLRVRVQRDLRDKFLEVCRAQDKPAAQVIREFMREYVDRHEGVPRDRTSAPSGSTRSTE